MTHNMELLPAESVPLANAPDETIVSNSIHRRAKIVTKWMIVGLTATLTAGCSALSLESGSDNSDGPSGTSWSSGSTQSPSAQPHSTKNPTSAPTHSASAHHSTAPKPHPSATATKKPRNPAEYGTEFNLTIKSTGEAVRQATTDLQTIGCHILPVNYFYAPTWHTVGVFQHNSGVSPGVPSITDIDKIYPAQTIGPVTRAAINRSLAAHDTSCGLMINPGWKKIPGCNHSIIGPVAGVKPGDICPDGKPVSTTRTLDAGCPGSSIPLPPEDAYLRYTCREGGVRLAGLYQNRQLIKQK